MDIVRVLELSIGVLMVALLLPVHESAHAFAADKLGDHTARSLGRLTMNPLRHIDPIGAIMLLAVHFGWGKPVPVDPRNFKNPKRDMAIVALAGPASNLLMAFALVVLFKVLTVAFALVGVNGNGILPWAVLYLVQSLALTSIYLAVFNMLPVPPLDGSRLLEYLIPGGYYARIARYQTIIYVVMMALLLLTDVLTRPMRWLAGCIFDGMDFLTGFITAIGGLFLR